MLVMLWTPGTTSPSRVTCIFLTLTSNREAGRDNARCTMIIESSLFLLAFLIGLLFGGTLGGMLSEIAFGMETRNDRLCITMGAVGGVILALSTAGTLMPPPL